MMAQETTLIDYERVMDDWNRRLIFFGRHAGLAGMINGLWALGKRLKREGMDNPFTQVRQARTYTDLNEVRTALEEMAGLIRQEGIPDSLHPLIIGITGYGNVSKGAQEILDLLPVQEISPHEIASLMANPSNFSKVMYKSVFKEEHSVKPIDSQAVFDLQDYYRSGKKSYENAFTPYLDSVTLLVNCVYWDNRYPRLLTREDCKTLWQEGKKPRLRVIADISCDIQGAVECTLKSTDPGNPVYVYHPQTGEITEGFDGHGPVIMAVDILPSELPRESSVWFSHVLTGFIESLAKADFSVDFDKLDLIPELKRAVILHHGRLTPDYEYIQQFL
jgi:alpha-aminoadipic semialdehyde synthase